MGIDKGQAGLVNILRGMMMGGADVIPGVSGGTVALVLGIYERLVTAISRFDRRLLRLLRQRQWRQAAAHVDFSFLATLAVGIGLGVVALGVFMNRLLTSPATRPFTLAAFFGMIVASAWIVGRSIRSESRGHAWRLAGLGAAGVAVAVGITSLPVTTLEPSYAYLFLCGMVAICAMILPGISGAYILLILGVYTHLTGVLRALVHGQVTADAALTVAVFAAACGVGLLSFSKVLRWLLKKRHAATMAVLCGFMIGALHKIWPFQQPETIPGTDKEMYTNVLPDAVDGRVLAVMATGIVAMLVVLVIERTAGRVAPPAAGKRHGEKGEK